MSRVGKKPIVVPAGVEVKIDGHKVTVKGPKGTLEKEFNQELTIKLENGEVVVERPNDEPKVRAIHGTRSEEHTSELQSRQYLVCRLLLEKKKYALRCVLHVSEA